MYIRSAELIFDKLVLDADLTDEDKALLDDFKAGEYQLKRKQYRRSRNANAYAWVLISQIGERLNIPAEKVYLNAIEEISGRTQVYSMPVNAVQDFRRYFVAGHIGRSVQVIGTNDGIADVLVTLGSSDYDTRQMSQLIDLLCQECRQLGIPTLEDLKLKELIEGWTGE